MNRYRKILLLFFALVFIGVKAASACPLEGAAPAQGMTKATDINVRDEAGRTPLILALGTEIHECDSDVTVRDPKAIRALIAAGSDVNAPDNKGETPLMNAAAWVGSPEVVDMLLAAGADPRAKSTTGETALMRAAARGNLPMASRLLALGVDVNAKTDDGTTALMLASEYGSAAIVSALLVAGADVHAKTKDGWTALAMAADSGYNLDPNVIATLLAAKADPNTVNKLGDSLLYTAVLRNRSAATLHALVAAGADINAKSRDGRTPLHLISGVNDRLNPVATDGIEKRAEKTALLIALGADVNAQDNTGWTPLMFAVSQYRNDYRDVVKVLLANGADVNLRDNNGETAVLHITIPYGLADLPLLVAAGADINARDAYGRTLLIDVTIRSNGGGGFVQTIVAAGADVNIQDKAGRTALSWMAQRTDFPEDIVFMLKHGADANIADNAGKRAIDYARPRLMGTSAFQMLQGSSK